MLRTLSPQSRRVRVSVEETFGKVAGRRMEPRGGGLEWPGRRPTTKRQARRSSPGRFQRPKASSESLPTRKKTSASG
jgi:hypothetical protein